MKKNRRPAPHRAQKPSARKQPAQKPAASAATAHAASAATASRAASRAGVAAAVPGALSAADVQRLFAVALTAHQQGRVAEAEAGYRAVLDVDPTHAFSNNNYAVLLKRAGRAAEAENLYRISVSTTPDDPNTRCNFATLYAETRRNDAALAQLRVALALKPDYPDAWFNIGNCLRTAGDKRGAETAYDRALNIRPDMAEPMANKGELLRERVLLSEAIGCYLAAVRLRPDLSAPFNNLGETLKEQGRLDEAVGVFKKGLELHPNETAMHSNLLFLTNYNPAVPAELAWRLHRRWGETHADPLHRPAGRPFANARIPDRRLRIGYVSPDFCTHSCAYFSEPLMSSHDRSAVELYLYAASDRTDSTTRRFQALADRWTSLVGLSDDQAAALIEADGVDILVDMAGHTCDHRLLTFARKPAPVQVSWLGYPNTTGMKAMDYRFTDAAADPPGAHDAWHSEKLVRLDGGFLCFRPMFDPGPPAPSPCLKNGFVTFGSFNNTSKVTPDVVKTWAELLRRVPGSRFIVKSRQLGDAEARRRIAAAFAANGVDDARCDLLPRIDAVSNHLRAYDLIDVAMDPFPYNGTTTTCEALWMGVPVATWAGEGHVARVGASILTHCGMGDLVAGSAAEYIDVAVRLAADPAALAERRAGVRGRMAASPLMDGARFARAVEAAYRDMWRRWCAGT